MADRTYEYDVALSFAGENRAYVEKVAEYLQANGISVFYDDFKEVELWGKDLIEHLEDVYQNKAKYCVLFISKHYKEKVWPKHEKRSALVRALEENGEFILPARFDDTEIPGLRKTIGYIDLRGVSPEDFAKKIILKLRGNAVKSQNSSAVTFRRPKKPTPAFNPYEEALAFIKSAASGIAERCSSLSSEGISSSVYQKGERTCVRVVGSGRTVYSLDMWMGSISRDSGISFASNRGEAGISSGMNAWGDIAWDRERELLVLELHDLSLLDHMGKTRGYSLTEFIDALWQRVCDAIDAGQ